MKKNIYTLMLTAPLLFTACNSTSVQPKIEKSIQVVQEATVNSPKKAPTVAKTSVVTYANEKSIVKDEGMMHIESFMTTMKSTLSGLMSSDPSHKTALGACSTLGQGLADDYNKIADVKVRRTALKYRNPKNKPDSTDTIVMEKFLQTKNFKEPQIVDMGSYYRVYKALKVKKKCLACHGSKISKDLKKIIEKTYPKDMATNFKLGEFRGAVVAKIKK